MNMQLKVMLPTNIIVNEAVSKIIAEGGEGSFCIKPKHTDYFTALVAGIFTYTTISGDEFYLAMNEGTLIKCGKNVLVSCRHAVMGTDLSTLRDLLDQHFYRLDQNARKARSAMASLEMGVVRKFIELQEKGQ